MEENESVTNSETSNGFDYNETPLQKIDRIMDNTRKGDSYFICELAKLRQQNKELVEALVICVSWLSDNYVDSENRTFMKDYEKAKTVLNNYL